MNSVIATFGCNSSENDIRTESSSGGAFSVLAEAIIKNGGVVYGTAMSDDCKEAIYRRVDTVDGVSSLRGSKYLQSKVGDTFKQVREDLQNGVQVMFSGCPCQVNGLKLFLRKDYDNLICMDIICHGVPSQELWEKYVQYFEEKNQVVLKRVNFRYKIGSSIQSFGFELKNTFSAKKDNSYMQMFLRNYDLRPSCYECASKTYRTADITIGDFWGVESIAPELNDSRGTSLVIIRTKIGKELFDKIADQIISAACQYEQATEINTAEYKSVSRPKQRNSFFLDMKQLSYAELEKKYIGPQGVRNIKKMIKKIIGRDNKNAALANSDYGLMLYYTNR